MKRPPGTPFVLLGRVPGRIGDYRKRPFAFRVPRVRPGVYRAFVYCRPCGGSLIQSGSRIDGETIRIRGAGLALGLARPPYVGLACRTPNSPVCGRVGMAVWLRRPALAVTAVLAGFRVTLHAGGLGGRGPKYWEGYVHLPKGALPPKSYSGDPPVFLRLQLALRYPSGTARGRVRVFLHPGWG